MDRARLIMRIVKEIGTIRCPSVRVIVLFPRSSMQVQKYTNSSTCRVFNGTNYPSPCTNVHIIVGIEVGPVEDRSICATDVIISNLILVSIIPLGKFRRPGPVF